MSTLKLLTDGVCKVDSKHGIIYKMSWGKWRELKVTPLPSGYIQYYIRNKHTGIFIYGHVAVWISVNGEYEEGLKINHDDFNRSNNAITNLNLGTQQENIEHSRKNKRYPITNKLKRLTHEEIKRIRRLLKKNYTQVAIANKIGLKRISVAYVCRQINAGKILKIENKKL